MKITFIRPNMFAGRAADAMTPLSFAILKSLTPDDIETAFYDERLETLPVDEPTDLVAMTVETYTARRSYQLAEQFRSRGVPVVMGGYHPTFLPDEALQYCDAVVVGDAEGVWQQVVEDFRNGDLQPIYRQDEFPDLAGSRPDRSIFRGKKYAPIDLVQYGRGCKYRCDFCSIRAFYGSVTRQRPVGEVVDEIRSLKRKHIFLVDDNIFVDLDKARELFEALVPLKIHWSCQVSIDVVQDHDLVELMRATYASVAAARTELENLLSLPSGYHRDLQYTKGALFHAFGRGLGALALLPNLLRGLQWKPERLAQAFDDGMFATDKAVELAVAGLPFREAYRLAAVEPLPKAGANPQASLEARVSPGGSGALGLAELRMRLSTLTPGA